MNATPPSPAALTPAGEGEQVVEQPAEESEVRLCS